MKKFEILGSPLDEIMLFSVHKFSVRMLHFDVIQELRNHCHPGLLYFDILQ